MKRIHNTHEENLTLYPCSYIQRGLRPTGIWYGLDDLWHTFLRENSPSLLMGNDYELDIDATRLYVIKNFTDLRTFMDKYWQVRFDYGHGQVEHMPAWRKIAMGYGGFEVKNYGYLKEAYQRYHYKNRNNPVPFWTWLYTLDSDCGCIWDISIIRSVKKIAMHDEKAEN